MGDIQSTSPDLYSRISTLISNGQKNIRQTVNTTIVDIYWNIGRLIVEEEQQGEETAFIMMPPGKQQLDMIFL